MENVRTLTIYAKEIKKEKQSFIVCTAVIKDKWYKIKFTKDCEITPKTKGIYDLTINFDNCSRELGKPFKDANGKKGISPDIIWVRKCESLRKYTEEELKERNRVSMTDVFGE